MKLSRRFWSFVGVASLVTLLDQITKWLAVGHLTRAFASVGEPLDFCERMSRFLWLRHPAREEPVTFIEGLWRFRYIENRGMVFGLFSGWESDRRWVVLLVAVLVALVFIIVYYRRTEPRQWLLRIALAMIFGGAVGNNVIDRPRLGYVIDFIEWHWYDKASWFVFNVADAAIDIGVALIILDMLLHRPPRTAGQRK